MIINILGWILLFLAINLGATMLSRASGEMKGMTFRQTYLYSCGLFLVILACFGVVIGIIAMILY